MSVKPPLLTPAGRDRLLAELDHLRAVRLPQAIDRLRMAREQESDSTAGEHQSAREDVALVQGRIRDIELLLAQAELAVPERDGSVGIGSEVRVAEEDGEEQTYTIVGVAEADPRAHRISYASPVGQALLGCRSGDVAQVETPGGLLRWRVLAVRQP
jgi:transcription elongation factor GreA